MTSWYDSSNDNGAGKDIKLSFLSCSLPSDSIFLASHCPKDNQLVVLYHMLRLKYLLVYDYQKLYQYSQQSDHIYQLLQAMYR